MQYILLFSPSKSRIYPDSRKNSYPDSRKIFLLEPLSVSGSTNFITLFESENYRKKAKKLYSLEELTVLSNGEIKKQQDLLKFRLLQKKCMLAKNFEMMILS